MIDENHGRSGIRQYTRRGLGHLGSLLLGHRCRGLSGRRGHRVGRVLSEVAKHVALFDEALATIRAAVGPLVGVGATVRDQVTLTHKVLVANVAAEWPLRVTTLVMRAHVKQEIAFEWKTLAAFGTNERTLAGVTAHMVDEMFLKRYNFLTIFQIWSY